MIGTRFGLSLGVAQVEVFTSAAARAAVLEAERVAQVAAGAPADVTVRPTRLAELLVRPDTSRTGVHAVLRDVAEAQAQLHALQAAAISRLAELQPAQQPLPGARADDSTDPDRPDNWVADEVAVVLGIGVSSATALVTKARALVEQLPQVWAAVADGLIDVRRCQVIVDALADRKHSAGGGLADDLVDAIAAHALGWIAEGIGPTTLTDRIGGALIAADPAEAERRAERRKGKQNVTTVGQGDGLASLRSDHADAADVAEELEVIDALAASMRRGGDKRPLGQLRVAAHHQLITRPWEILPPDVLRARWNLHLRVDLTDLDDLGPLTNQPRTDADTGADADAEAQVDAEAATTAEAEAGVDEEAGVDAEAEIDDEAKAAADAESPRAGGAGHSAGSDRSGSRAGRVADDGSTGGVAADGAATTTWLGSSTGSGVGAIGRLPISPVAVAELLARYEALMPTGPGGRVDGGEVWFEILDVTGRLRALTSPAEARAALRRGTGLGPPPAIDGYAPSAAQIRFVKARDRHCRFPGCHRPAEYVDLDHVVPRDHHTPTAGGRTCVTNLVCLCRRHHRLKTHAPGWHFAMDPDGTLHVTPPGGRTRTTRPTAIAETDMSTRTHLYLLTDLIGRTPTRFRSRTPEERSRRRAAAAERARIAADIEAELDAALASKAAEDDCAGPGLDGIGDSGAGPGLDGVDAADPDRDGTDDRDEDPPPF